MTDIFERGRKMKYEVVKVEKFDDRSQKGCRTTYRVTGDKGIFYVCADYAEYAGCAESMLDVLLSETMLFHCDENGDITNWDELWRNIGDTASNHKCIEEWMIEGKGDRP